MVTGSDAGIALGVIRKRRDFLALRRAATASTPSFLMAAGKSPPGNMEDGARLGLTVTKKLGGAVIRNRIRRRLRAAAREVFPLLAQPGVDYVLIARRSAYDRDFALLLDDMKGALLRLRRVTK